MAKKKSTTTVDLDALYKEIAASTGGDVLDQLEDVNFYVDTGSLAVNFACSGRFIHGGIPGGKVTEAYGPEASGKSLIGSNVLAGTQNIDGWAILIDCENSSDAEFMKTVSHLNVKRVIRYAPSSLENAFHQIHIVTKKIRDLEKKQGIDPKPITVVFDSLTVPPCERELRENDLPMDYSAADWKKIVGRKEQPGERAKVISKEMRKLNAMTHSRDVTVYLINQTRQKIGVMYGSPEAVPGGNAVKFYSSCRIRTAAQKKIEHKKLGKFSGINLQVRNVKNRTFRPFVTVNDIKLFFDEGVDPLAGLLTCLIESERVSGKGTYEVAEGYLPDGKTSYKFRAKKAENRIAAQVLLDCPKLIDAESTEEVQTYLDRWGSGLAASESGNYMEKSVAFDADGNPEDVEEEDDYKSLDPEDSDTEDDGDKE